MENILIVEDDAGVRENTVELLKLYGYHAYSAQNGIEGYRLAVNTMPDIVVCDVTKPEAGGHDLLRLLRGHDITRHIPVVFFSAGSAPHLLRKGLFGADGYVAKPFTDIELLSVIRRCLGATVAHNPLG